jgi:hypothetical protein
VDGSSEGEQAIDELLETVVAKGVCITNIVPDRNWNFVDPAVRKVKADKLDAFVAKNRDLDLPLNVGTEMNSPGNRLMDDFDVPELDKHRALFLDGAYFIYGHTVMQRRLGMGYQSGWARQSFGNRREANGFFTAVGKAVEPGPKGRTALQHVTAAMTPADILTQLPQL